MITITIDEFVNLTTVRGYDTKSLDYFLNEGHEERVEALRVLHSWIVKEINRELEQRRQYASEM